MGRRKDWVWLEDDADLKRLKELDGNRGRGEDELFDEYPSYDDLEDLDDYEDFDFRDADDDDNDFDDDGSLKPDFDIRRRRRQKERDRWG